MHEPVVTVVWAVAWSDSPVHSHPEHGGCTGQSRASSARATRGGRLDREGYGTESRSCTTTGFYPRTPDARADRDRHLGCRLSDSPVHSHPEHGGCTGQSRASSARATRGGRLDREGYGTESRSCTTTGFYPRTPDARADRDRHLGCRLSESPVHPCEACSWRRAGAIATRSPPSLDGTVARRPCRHPVHGGSARGQHVQASGAGSELPRRRPAPTLHRWRRRLANS